MLIVFVVLSILVIVIGVFCEIAVDCFIEDVGKGLTILGGFALIITIVCILAVGLNFSNIINIDNKIKVYEEENQNIEKSVQEIVESYRNYEGNTYSEYLKNVNIEGTDILALGQLFPELKTNELVSKQIDIYVENNNQIKDLKIKKQDLAKYKWWLCFSTKIDKE